MAIETTHRTSAQALTKIFQSRARTIAEDEHLTPRYRHALLAQDYLKTSEQLRQLGEQHRAELAAQRSQLVRNLYGDADVDALRDATASLSARVSGDRDQKFAIVEQALERAQRMGDEVGALAALNVATENGFNGVAETYLATRPAKAAAFTALQKHDFEAADPTDRMFTFRVPRPGMIPAGAHLQQLAAEAAVPPAEVPVR